ncbi:MAG: hypothetical protein R2751_17895 [Bacteroidales bacterium]
MDRHLTTEQSRMSALNLEGVGKSEKEDILEKINLRPGQQVTADIMDNTETDHPGAFHREGFRNTDVDILLY